MTKKKAEPIVVTLKAGEKEYELANGINSFCDLESEFDVGINQIIKMIGDEENLKLTDVRRYLRVVLRREGEPMEEKHADDVCEIAGVSACSGAVVSHVLANFANG